jgi:hypothetical protein
VPQPLQAVQTAPKQPPVEAGKQSEGPGAVWWLPNSLLTIHSRIRWECALAHGLVLCEGLVICLAYHSTHNGVYAHACTTDRNIVADVQHGPILITVYLILAVCYISRVYWPVHSLACIDNVVQEQMLSPSIDPIYYTVVEHILHHQCRPCTGQQVKY